MDLKVVPLHHHPELTKSCCDLINSEWKRSETARLHSLKASCDTLPTCLVLLKNRQVIGHAKLSKLPSVADSCFVESVIIERNERGKGFGKILMEKSEEYCRDFLKIRTVYLATRGQEGFYKKLGYNVCKPVSMYGGSVVPKKSESELIISTIKNDLVELCKNVSLKNDENSKNSTVLLPVPPPLPLDKEKSKTQAAKIYMKKELS